MIELIDRDLVASRIENPPRAPSEVRVFELALCEWPEGPTGHCNHVLSGELAVDQAGLALLRQRLADFLDQFKTDQPCIGPRGYTHPGDLRALSDEQSEELAACKDAVIV